VDKDIKTCDRNNLRLDDLDESQESHSDAQHVDIAVNRLPIS
jgi:hypothetical protein